MRKSRLTIRSATPQDFDKVWQFFKEIITQGDSYPIDPTATFEEALNYWFSPGARVYLAEDERGILASYYLKANQPGLGSHVANAGYIVNPAYRRQGVGRHICLHSLEEAKVLGFQAMQYNLVVSTNLSAVTLWKKTGFHIAATLPKAFRHKDLGLVDAYIMYQWL